jgi:protein-S-isoprenylcysteine O-methyltransferase Ste14
VSSTEHPPRYWFRKSYADFVQRLRVASGFLLLLTFAWFSRPHALSMAFGLPISLCGLAIRAWAAGHLAKDRNLATSGPYSYVRNPLYAGTLLTALGIVIASRSATLSIIFAAVFLLVYLPVIELEEQHLRTIFPQYSSYAGRVRRLIPTGRWTAGKAPFSFALYKKNQEYKAAAGFAIAVLWLIWKCRIDGRP